MLIRPRHASSCNSLFPRPGPAVAGQLWQLVTADARCSAGQAELGRAAAGGRASNSRNRLVSRILYFETQTRVRETGCSDTETVMIVFWLLNLIWALLGSATGIDKKTSNIWFLSFCNIFQFCSDWINWVWPEPDRGWAGREEGRIALMMSCCDLQPATAQPWVGFKIYI